MKKNIIKSEEKDVWKKSIVTEMSQITELE